MRFEELEKLREERDEFKKHIRFLVWLNKELKERGIMDLPVLVGGGAVEVYTFGLYL